MKKLTIKRIAEILDGTFGVLLDEDIPFALTLERRWLNNEKGKSCIPLGIYLCKRIQSPKFGNTFEVAGVLGRDAILFHKGNLDDDSHGCILIGEQFESLKGKIAILASDKGFTEFLQRLEGIDIFNLEIIPCF